MADATDDRRIGTVIAGYRIESRIGARRHGRRLPGRAPQPRAPGGAQDHRARPRRVVGLPRALRARGADRRRARSTRTSSPSTTPARSTGRCTSRCSTSRAPTSPRVLSEQGRLRPYRAIDVCRQVAAALDAAHALGLIHRDVKPANVLIEGRAAFLTDFGLTQAPGRRRHRRSRTAGDVVGTIHYVAPEQIEGAKVDRAQRRLLARLPALPLPGRARCRYAARRRRRRDLRAPLRGAAEPSACGATCRRGSTP